jgi:protein involved in polysaccharide export with SLBB domain
MKYSNVVVLLLILLVAWGSAEAQINPSSLLSALSERITSTNYYYARPNDLTLIVNVVGYVQRPGRYEIATSIDLVNLISLAGGPTPDGTLSKVTITRMVKVGGMVQAWKYRFDLEEFGSIKAEDLILSPGDIVYVDRTAWSSFRDVFSVTLTVATVSLAVAEAFYFAKH